MANKQTNHRFRFVIVGGGVAGGCACREFVLQGVPGDQILLITSEFSVPYERPIVSKDFLSGKVQSRDFFSGAAEGQPQDEEWYKQHGITIFQGCLVTDVKLGAKWLTTNTQGTVGFDKVLLCTGASSKRLDVRGSNADGICYLRSIADARMILTKLKSVAKMNTNNSSQSLEALVVGGGYLAMECAMSLVEHGLCVTMVYPSEHLNSRLWSPQISIHYERLFEARGIKLRPGSFVSEFETINGRSTGATLSTGEFLKALFSVIAIGSHINLKLVKDQLELQGRGIRVDAHMQTSCKGVYAVGDICSFMLKGNDRAEVMEHADHARKSAAHAVQHMCGASHEEYTYNPHFYSRGLGIDWHFYGDPRGYEFVGCGPADREDSKSLKLCAAWVSNTGRVNGAMLESGTPEELDCIQDVVLNRKRVCLEQLRKTQSCETFLAVLRAAGLQVDAPSLKNEEEEPPCKLSRAEINRTLQELSQEEYAYLVSSKFADKSKQRFKTEKRRSLVGLELVEATHLSGDYLRDAISMALLPHQAEVVLASVDSEGRLDQTLDAFGGAPALRREVSEEYFPDFARFCLAWCLWRGFDVQPPDGDATQVDRLIRNVQNETLQELTSFLGKSNVDDQQAVGRVLRRKSVELAASLTANVGVLSPKAVPMKAKSTQTEEVEQDTIEAFLKAWNTAPNHRVDIEELINGKAHSQVDRMRRMLKAMNAAYTQEVAELRKALAAPGLEEIRTERYQPLSYVEEEDQGVVAAIVALNVREILSCSLPMTELQRLEKRDLPELIRSQREVAFLRNQLTSLEDELADSGRWSKRGSHEGTNGHWPSQLAQTDGLTALEKKTREANELQEQVRLLEEQVLQMRGGGPFNPTFRLAQSRIPQGKEASPRQEPPMEEAMEPTVRPATVSRRPSSARAGFKKAEMEASHISNFGSSSDFKASTHRRPQSAGRFGRSPEQPDSLAQKLAFAEARVVELEEKWNQACSLLNECAMDRSTLQSSVHMFVKDRNNLRTRVQMLEEQLKKNGIVVTSKLPKLRSRSNSPDIRPRSNSPDANLRRFPESCDDGRASVNGTSAPAPNSAGIAGCMISSPLSTHSISSGGFSKRIVSAGSSRGNAWCAAENPSEQIPQKSRHAHPARKGSKTKVSKDYRDILEEATKAAKQAALVKNGLW